MEKLTDEILYVNDLTETELNQVNGGDGITEAVFFAFGYAWGQWQQAMKAQASAEISMIM